MFAVSTAGIESIIDRYLHQQARITNTSLRALADFRRHLIKTLAVIANATASTALVPLWPTITTHKPATPQATVDALIHKPWPPLP